MQRLSTVNDTVFHGGPTLGDLLTARPSGLTEPEAWAVLCQSVQALQDLFLSDGASCDSCVPLVTPSMVAMSSRGRVRLRQTPLVLGYRVPVHLAGYLAPEYRPHRRCSDTDAEKMWIYALGETLKRATLTSHAVTSRISKELCQILTDMTRIQVANRASLMYLLDIISEYCKRRGQNRPFSHIVMDLHQEAMAALETTLDTPWGPPAMPDLRTTRNRYDAHSTSPLPTLPRLWRPLRRNTKEASTSMEDITLTDVPGTVARPKSICVPRRPYDDYLSAEEINPRRIRGTRSQVGGYARRNTCGEDKMGYNSDDYLEINYRDRLRGGYSDYLEVNMRRDSKRHPVQRAASRLYRAGVKDRGSVRDYVGPEFVVKAGLPAKKVVLDGKVGGKKGVTVILLNGQKLDVVCNVGSTTAGQLLETIIQQEHISENFMLGISALIAGDFVFLPSDTRLCKVLTPGPGGGTLFLRVRFFLPSLRCLRGPQARHLLYLQLRRAILEHQLPCSFGQLVQLDGFALQAEFGDWGEKEHGIRDYFLLEHYVPETMSCAVSDEKHLREELVAAHKSKRGISYEKAEQEFITIAQSLPHYGGHFYTATWVSKDNNANKDVWLYISAQGINLYERGKSSGSYGPQVYERFEWRAIQTLCYSKHYLCIIPQLKLLPGSKVKKYKLKMDHKKSYFAFRLASLHHQFFLRLRTEYTSLQTLSQQFGIPLKDIKNETNSMYKLETMSSDYITLDRGSVNAETEFKIQFPTSSSRGSSERHYESIRRRSKSVNDFIGMKDNLQQQHTRQNNNNNNYGRNGLVLDSSCFSDLPTGCGDKRSGVKMGTRAIGSGGARVSRSMEAINGCDEDAEQMSLQSVSLPYFSSPSTKSPIVDADADAVQSEAYIIDSTIKSPSKDNLLLPDFQESISESLLHKLDSLSFIEERNLSSITIERDSNGSLGLQITEGSDGNVYVQSVIFGGPSYLTGSIHRGDQVIAVDRKSLLGMKYDQALEVLKNTGSKVELILSRVATDYKHSTLRAGDCNNTIKNRMNLSDINESHIDSLRLENTMNKLKRSSNGFSSRGSPVEKHLTESCHDVSNKEKYYKSSAVVNAMEVPYHKHIRYEIEPEKDNNSECNDSINKNTILNRIKSKSCNQIYNPEHDRAVVVGVIPKSNISKFHSLDRKVLNNNNNNCKDDKLSRPVSSIALPRSLGLSRRWRGPVRYPVTPVKKFVTDQTDCDYNSLSDEEQIKGKWINARRNQELAMNRDVTKEPFEIKRQVDMPADLQGTKACGVRYSSFHPFFAELDRIRSSMHCQL